MTEPHCSNLSHAVIILVAVGEVNGVPRPEIPLIRGSSFFLSLIRHPANTGMHLTPKNRKKKSEKGNKKHTHIHDKKAEK
jgi:hypothetical protein